MRKQVSYSISTAIPDDLRRKLNLIYQRSQYKNGIAEMIRELLTEAVDRRIQTEVNLQQ